MFNFLFGPFLAVLPKRWRRWLPFLKSMDWRVPSILSGFGELVFGIIAYMYWCSYSMNTWVSRGLDAALAGKMDPRVTDHDITIMSLFIFPTHPLTWMILYVAAEGSVRLLGAAFSESYLGLEESSRSSEPRPFHYRLRRLSAGVMSRTVLVYAPEQEPVVCEK